jgi:hypothetical protein
LPDTVVGPPWSAGSGVDEGLRMSVVPQARRAKIRALAPAAAQR